LAHPAVSRYLDALHRQCAKSAPLVKLALKVRDQANAVISKHMADGTSGHQNGEQLLIDIVAPYANSFIDVGANVGAWTLAFAAKSAKPAWGIAFEPSPVAFDTLLKTVNSIPSQHECKIEVVPKALADVSGQMTFYAEPNAGETSSFLGAHSNSAASGVKVSIGTLDEELAIRSIERVDMVKIDAEGYDCKVLRGAIKSITRQALGVIQFEYNEPWAMAGDTLYSATELVTRHGYKVFLLKRDGLYHFEWERYREFFGYSNFVAVSPRFLPLLRPIVVGRI
jgi:FkbM family methyltransferase